MPLFRGVSPHALPHWTPVLNPFADSKEILVAAMLRVAKACLFGFLAAGIYAAGLASDDASASSKVRGAGSGQIATAIAQRQPATRWSRLDSRLAHASRHAPSLPPGSAAPLCCVPAGLPPRTPPCTGPPRPRVHERWWVTLTLPALSRTAQIKDAVTAVSSLDKQRVADALQLTTDLDVVAFALNQEWGPQGALGRLGPGRAHALHVVHQHTSSITC